MFLWQIRKYKLKTGNEREQNICVVINTSRKERREHREVRNIWHCLCYKRIFYIFVRTINDNVV